MINRRSILTFAPAALVSAVIPAAKATEQTPVIRKASDIPFEKATIIDDFARRAAVETAYAAVGMQLAENAMKHAASVNGAYWIKEWAESARHSAHGAKECAETATKYAKRAENYTGKKWADIAKKCAEKAEGYAQEATRWEAIRAAELSE